MKRPRKTFLPRTVMLLIALFFATVMWAQTTTIQYTATSQVTKFDTYANFTGATAVQSHTFTDGVGTVVFEGTVTALGTRALNSSTSLTGINLPAGITAIGERAFDGCSKLASVTFADDAAVLASISDYAFAGCDALTSFVVPNSVTTFGNFVFQSCDALTSVTLGEGIPELGEFTFLNCKNLETVVFAGTPTLTAIGPGAFKSCSALTAIDIPASVVKICSDAFSDCAELASVTFSTQGALTTIEGSAFSSCKKLTSITLPETLTTLGHVSVNYMNQEQQNGSVFWGSGLTSLHLPKSITNIYGGGHVANCPLTSLTMEDDGWPYESPKGSNAIVDQRNRTLVIGCAATKNLTNLQFIGEEAFWAEQQPFSLTLPYNLVQIRKRAFHLASGLTAITIPEGVSTIPEDCFSGTSLTTLMLSDGVTEIEKNAFMYCPNLKTVYLGRYLTSIGEWAFEMCEAVTDVYCAADPTRLEWDGKGFASTTVFHVKDAAAWQNRFPSAKVTFETYAPEEEFVNVGKPSSPTHLPIGARYSYMLSQQLFTAEQIGHAAGKLTSIGFNTVNGNVTRKLDVYVCQTDATSLSDYQPVNEDDLVYSGDFYFKSNQWNAIDFQQPFLYDGTRSLLVTVYDHTGTEGDYSTLSNRIVYQSSQFVEADADLGGFDPTNANSVSSYPYKSQIQLCFEANPKPAYLTAVDVTNESAQIQCTLRGDAEKWSLRYRRVASEGEEEQRWVQIDDLGRSYTIEGLEPATQYEVQAQAVYGEDVRSVWTAPLTFYTSCCSEEDMCYILYSMNVGFPNGAAFQIVDAETGIEAAYVQFVTSGVSGGALSLCNDRVYNVNFIVNDAAPYQTRECNFTLFYAPGDEFYTMNFNQAPQEDSQLTSFVMECGNYCTPRPRFFTTGEVNYQSAELSYDAMTKKEEIQYSTDPTFPDNENTKTVVVTRDAVEEHTTYVLSGLESLTLYYVRVRSKCDSDGGDETDEMFSRWTPPVQIITESKYSRPTRVKTTAVDSKTEDLAWRRKGMEGKNDVNYRMRGESTPASNVLTIDLDGDGDTFNKFGATYESYTYGTENPDNVIAIYNVPANAMVSWKAAQGVTGHNTAYFQSGFAKQTKNYSDEEAAVARETLTIALQAKKQQKEEQESQPDFVEKTLADAKILEDQIAQTEAELADMPDGPEKDEKEAFLIVLQWKLDDILINSLTPSMVNENVVREVQQASEQPQSDTQQSNVRSMMHRAPDTGDEEYYFFFIRHTMPNDILLVQDITVTPKENIGEWITIPNVEDVNYVLKNLQPGREYEVMVQPVYESGVKGLHSPISVFTTLGTESEPIEGVFSVGDGKKVQFAKGNLQYSKDENWNAHWSFAEHQYDIFGLNNLQTQELNEYGNRYPSEEHLDLFCWSAGRSANGTVHTYPDDSYYTGEFIEWGTLPSFKSIYGQGWFTLSKDEWNYLLNERKNAATLRSFATVNGTKGLILLPDEWNAPDGIMIKEEMTAEEWPAIENTGVVFLPAAGTLTVSSVDYNTVATVNDVNLTGSYWSRTPSTTDVNSFAMTFTDSEDIPVADIYRRIGSAVRLVKCIELPVTTAASGYTTLVSTETLDVSEVDGLTAFIATNVDNTVGTVMLQRIDMVPANTPIVLKGEPSTTYALKTSFTTATPPAANLLKGSATESIELADGEAYILSDGKFYRNNAGIMPAGKAYLPATAVASGVRQIKIVFDDETTVIRTLNIDDTPTRIISIYNLQGQRVMKPGKGIYIINGKKVFIK